MRKYKAAIIILFIPITGIHAQDSTVFKVQKRGVKEMDVVTSMSVKDTASKGRNLIDFRQILELPESVRLLSCEVACSSRGEVFKTQYYNDGTGILPKTITDILDRLKPGDIIFLDNAVVLKNGVKTKWPGQKSYTIR